MFGNSINSVGSYLGQMSAQSVQKRHDKFFNKLDTDGSGGIDKTEFAEFAKRLSEKRGSSVNVDDVYTSYDKNGDGVLGKDEIEAFMKDNAPPLPPGLLMNPAAMKRLDVLFGRLDKDSSDGIDKAEFDELAKRVSEKGSNSINIDDVYTSYDKDKDGVLNKTEFGAFMKDNAPQPPVNRKSALASYKANDNNLQSTAVMDSIKEMLSEKDKASEGKSAQSGGLLVDLVNALSGKSKGGIASLLLNLTA